MQNNKKRKNPSDGEEEELHTTKPSSINNTNETITTTIKEEEDQILILESDTAKRNDGEENSKATTTTTKSSSDDGKEGKGEEEELIILRDTTDIFPNLPLEIIFDILARLPIKTLSQSKWVSKSWYKIITHRRFARVQHAKAIQNFLPCVTYFEPHLKEFYLVDSEVFENHGTSTTVHHCRITEFGWSFVLVGVCNGLICMSPDPMRYKPEPYFIFNPVTREYINLPNSPKCEIASYGSGFGFDPLNNEYKVVRIMATGEVEVYALGSGLLGWRRISDAPSDLCKDQSYGRRTMLDHGRGVLKCPVFLNGALHWLIFAKVETRFSIVALDMSTEQFREISAPPSIAPCFSFSSSRYIGVLGGCLSFTDGGSVNHSDVWVMKSYGVQESWSKEYGFRKRGFIYEDRNDGCEVIKLESGELLLKHLREGAQHIYERDLLHYYDPKRNVYTHIETHGLPSSISSLQPLVHVGSLVSPKTIGRSTKSECKDDNSFEASLV